MFWSRMSAIRAVAWAVAALAAVAAPAQELKTVAVTAIVEHPALDAARAGLQDELAAAGYELGHNLDLLFASAGGNAGKAAEIARRFVAERPDVIVPISTPSAQAVVAATDDIPVVFTAVTDPLGAGLVGDLGRPGGNVTGMSDLSPIDRHLDLIREILPRLGRLGVVYNPDEANSLTLLGMLRSEAAARGLEIVEARAAREAEVGSAAAGLVGRADAVYVPTDNTAVAALEAIVEVGTANRLPVFAGDVASVARGAVAALGFNYYDLGRQTGRIVVRVLEGERPGSIPVETIRTTELFVNPKAAQAMGVAIPDAVRRRAKIVE